jgi:hypothetical protein
MSRLPVPILVIITGEGGSGGALPIAIGNRVYMLENYGDRVTKPGVAAESELPSGFEPCWLLEAKLASGFQPCRVLGARPVGIS